jgi:hypothetical protein
MLKFVLSAVVILSSSTAALAGQTFVQPDKTVSYIFESSGGQQYCDGITLSQKANMAIGYHTGTCLGSPSPNAGGFTAHVVGLPAPVWTITTTDPRNPTFTVVYLIDESNLTYTAWYEVTNVTGFQEGASGLLGIGTPPNTPGLKSSTWMMR